MLHNLQEAEPCPSIQVLPVLYSGLRDTVLPIHWFAYIDLLILRTACVDYSVFNSTMLARMFSAGVLVVRGKDWQWGDQGSGRIGNITQGLGVFSHPGWIEVLWADGHQNDYRVGNSGKYDVCRVVGKKMLLYETYRMQYKILVVQWLSPHHEFDIFVRATFGTPLCFVVLCYAADVNGSIPSPPVDSE